MLSRLAFGVVAVTTAVLAHGPLNAQQEALPLQPLPPSGDIVAPFFDGWWSNPDGTYTLSFGFFNRNTQEVIEIPVGPNNKITPAEYDGLQPTHFPAVNYGGFSGRRERGAFAVTVPADFATKEVVWSLTHRGKTYSVPGRVTSPAYELSHTPQAAGTLPPSVRVEESANPYAGRGQGASTKLSAKVGQPVALRVWGEDRGDREERYGVNATWVKHQGPGSVTFEPVTGRTEAPGGMLSTNATFSAPGEYVVRVRVDNFTASDSSFADQCCWSNGFYTVTVTP